MFFYRKHTFKSLGFFRLQEKNNSIAFSYQRGCYMPLSIYIHQL